MKIKQPCSNKIRKSDPKNEENCEIISIFQGKTVELGSRNSCNFFFSLLPGMVQRKIFLYTIEKDEKNPLALSEVNELLNKNVKLFLKEMMEQNLNRICEFISNSYVFANICYLESFNQLSDKNWVTFRNTFANYINGFVNHWCKEGYNYSVIDDVHIFQTNALNVVLYEKNNSSIFFFNKLLERYLLSDRFKSEVEKNVKLAEKIKALRFLARHQLKQKYGDAIPEIISYLLQQHLKTGNYNYLLCLKEIASQFRFGSRTEEAAVKAAELIIFTVNKFNDDATISLNNQFYLIQILNGVLGSFFRRDIELPMNPNLFVKLVNYAILKLKDPQLSSDFQSDLITMFKLFVRYNIEKCRKEEIEKILFFKNYSLSKLKEVQASLTFQVELITLLSLFLERGISLEVTEVLFLRNFVFSNLEKDSYLFHGELMLLLGNILYFCKLQLQVKEADTLVKYGLQTFQNDSSPFMKKGVLFLLSVLMTQPIFNQIEITNEEANFLMGYVIEKLMGPSMTFSIHKILAQIFTKLLDLFAGKKWNIPADKVNLLINGTIEEPKNVQIAIDCQNEIILDRILLIKMVFEEKNTTIQTDLANELLTYIIEKLKISEAHLEFQKILLYLSHMVVQKGTHIQLDISNALMNITIQQLKNTQAPEILQSLRVWIISMLLYRPGIQIDDSVFLKKFVITTFKDFNFSKDFQRNIISLLITLIEKTTIQPKEINSLVSFAITNLTDAKTSLVNKENLILFLKKGVVKDVAIPPNLMNSLITYFTKTLRASNGHLDFKISIIDLLNLILNKNINIELDKANSLKTYAIEILKKNNSSLINLNGLIILLAALLNENLKLELNEVNILKEYARAILSNSSSLTKNDIFYFLANQQAILMLLDRIIKKEELFNMVTPKFFENIESYLINEYKTTYSRSRGEELVKFYGTFKMHTNNVISSKAAEICQKITDCIKDQGNQWW